MGTMPTTPALDIYRFGAFEVDVRTAEVRRRGIRVALQQQPWVILSALLERPGEIVARDELCRRLWPQGTFVDFEHSLNAAVRRLRVALGDQAEVPRFVETVHKRGYRFIAMNDIFPHRANPPAGRAYPATIAHIVRSARLAVLPFGPYDGFTEGLTEEAITQLARGCPQDIGVIARTAVERARRDGAGAAEVGRALGADYLLEGSVRRDGERLRITAQLIESQEETHVWASTFDRVLADVLTIQTEVAEAIAKGVTHAIAVTRSATGTTGQT